MYKKFLILFIVLAITASANIGCSPEAPTDDTESRESLFDNSVPTFSPLPQTADAGMEYIDEFVFLGESTTYHLKSRGVLSGGTDTKQVWAPKSGTLMLDPTTSNARIIYPDSGEELDLSVAAARKKPKYILLTFGLNGAVSTVRHGENYFKDCYTELIDTLLTASPESIIILQACFPVSAAMDMSDFSINAETLNEYIDRINRWSCELSEQLGIGYLNTAEILKTDDGYLLPEYDAGDGYHLSREAYLQILKYMRTHAYGG